MLDESEDGDQLREEARDARFSPLADAAIAALKDDPEARAELSHRWSVSEATLDALGAGLREDLEKVGGTFTATGRVAFTMPLSSGSARGEYRTIGALRVYRHGQAPDRLVSGGRHGLVLPWGLWARPGPIVVCASAHEAAVAWERGCAAVGLSDPIADLEDLALLLESPEAEGREIHAVAPPSYWGRRWSARLSRRLAHRIRRPVAPLELPTVATPATPTRTVTRSIRLRKTSTTTQGGKPR